MWRPCQGLAKRAVIAITILDEFVVMPACRVAFTNAVRMRGEYGASAMSEAKSARKVNLELRRNHQGGSAGGGAPRAKSGLYPERAWFRNALILRQNPFWLAGCLWGYRIALRFHHRSLTVVKVQCTKSLRSSPLRGRISREAGSHAG
jgi:hypothetical protein